MSAVLDWYRDVMTNKSDPRTSGWFLMASPAPVLLIVISYVYFCSSAGPRYMKDKKPYSLRKPLFLYNFLHILLSLYLMREGLMSGWLGDYSFRCQPVDYSDNPKALRMASATHMYFISKLTELLDTVFFVLRKKDRQISFLHLYHHAIMPFGSWIGVRFTAGGQPTLMGTINAFVHVVMYSYYMLSSLGPEAQKYLWWKKYVTVIQLVQFVIVFFHCAQTFFIDCDFPKPLMIIMSVNALLFFYLFSSFYIATYVRKEPSNGQLTETNGRLDRKLD